MTSKLLEYIDFERVNTLLEGFNQSTGFVTAILDLDGNILSKSGWRQICTDFHRVNAETSKRCTISDTVLAGQMKKGEKYHFYKCLNGMVDVAVPIIIKGEHIANLFSGQFFFEKPDISFFQKQAAKYSFNNSGYLQALKEVPVISEEKVKTIIGFLLNMTELISEMTFQRLELMKLNDTLRTSEERYRLVLENSMDAILLTSPEGGILSANAAACNMFQRSEEEICKIGRSSLVDMSDPNLHILIEERNRTGKAKGEISMLRKDGTKFPVELSTSVFTDPGGKLLSSMVIRDISDRKNAEAQLIIAKEKAEESNRLKTAFLQNMSHEIRTPMNAIMGFSELLSQYFDNKPKLEYFSKIINQRCNDLLIIINDILDIAKIEAGQLSVNIENCNINSLFDELKILFSEHQKKHNKQHIKLVLPTHVEPALVFKTDNVKLKQIFINLIGNAFKYTNDGVIEAGYKTGDNQLIFFVSDTGIGIPAGKQQLIFERFIQIEPSANRLYGGNGLGLSIVKGLVGLLGGKIWLESELNKGSAFYFSLPCKIEEASKENPAITNERHPEITLPEKTILVVEDDIYNAEYIKEILSDTGLNILYTRSGIESVQIATTKHPDLILMDIGLPDISGYDAIQQIQQQKPYLKIIAQTAYAAPSDKQQALDSGCVDYISKPLKPELLISLINKHL